MAQHLDPVDIERRDDDFAPALTSRHQRGLRQLHDRLLAEGVRDDLGAPALLAENMHLRRLVVLVTRRCSIGSRQASCQVLAACFEGDFEACKAHLRVLRNSSLTKRASAGELAW